MQNLNDYTCKISLTRNNSRIYVEKCFGGIWPHPFVQNASKMNPAVFA